MNKIIKYKIRIVFFIQIVIIFTLAQNAFSQQSPLFYKGGVDSLKYNADTVMIENTITDDGSLIGKNDQLVAGFSFFATNYLKMFYVPVSYFMLDNLRIDFSLPFVSKSLEDGSILYNKNGYGDTKVAAAVFYNLSEDIGGITSLKITLPTGDATANESGFIVPLGYGGYSYSLLQTLSFNVGPPLRFFLNAGSTFYAASTTDVYTIDKIFIYYMMLGCEYSYSYKLFFQLKANYIYMPERKYLIKATSVRYDRNDSLTSSDVIASIKYLFQDNVTGNLTGIYPVYVKQDSDISEKHKDGFKVFLSIEKRFTNNYSANYEKKTINKKQK